MNCVSFYASSVGVVYLYIHACVSPVKPFQPLIWASWDSDWWQCQWKGWSLSRAGTRDPIYHVTEEICLHSKLLIRMSEILRITNVSDCKHVFLSPFWFRGQERWLWPPVRTWASSVSVTERVPPAVHSTLTQKGSRGSGTLWLHPWIIQSISQFICQVNYILANLDSFSHEGHINVPTLCMGIDTTASWKIGHTQAHTQTSLYFYFSEDFRRSNAQPSTLPKPSLSQLTPSL